jgi:ABC-2 type transport system permease protein
MNPPSNAVLEPAAAARAPLSAASSPTRPLYWSVRRELWENRSVYLAPLGVGAFFVVGLVIHALTMPSHMPGMLGTAPGTLGNGAVMYRFTAMLLMVTAFVVGAFYCADALSGERRDRSILFWKSLPVSDLTTVLAKAGIPLVVLPLLTFAVIATAQLVLLLLSTLALLVQGQGAVPLWNEVNLPELWPRLLYAVAAATLWHAPIYGFLLMVSAWARRTAALWAVLPLLALGLLEKATMNTLHVASLVRYALIGWYRAAFNLHAPETIPFHPLNSLAPGRFLGTPALWIGLALAAVFLAAAVRLRRYREPS